MKARIFIGSSVEGLNVAYAVQQNLLHDAEITVWDQGVFEISSTTIESLEKAISTSDFGIFVFTPDDALRMRGEDHSSVRDNVLFEMGLFAGKIGRERVFFLTPSDSPPHIPTDLLGVSPAKYEANRSDGSMQAATGPACHQIRAKIKKLGTITPEATETNLPVESEENRKESGDWIDDFFNKKYEDAKSSLISSLAHKKGDEEIEAKAWIHYCDFKVDEKIGLNNLLNFAKENPDSAFAQKIVSRILSIEKYTDKAIELLESLGEPTRNHPTIITALSDCLTDIHEHEKAIELLSNSASITDPQCALAISSILENQEKPFEAIKFIHNAYSENPRNKKIKYKYARLAQETGKHEIAIYLLNSLAEEDPDSIENWGYLGNTCLALDLYDSALMAYRKAEALSGDDQSDLWITSNIGNLFNNKELPTEAEKYLKISAKNDPDSQYAHNRLASALKKKEEEQKKFNKKVAEGLQMIRSFTSK